MGNEVTTHKRESIVVIDPVPILDTARFEHMQRIAKIMASATLIPDGLCMEGTGDKKALLPYDQIFANCFLVTNQAVRWGMDPFAVAACCSVVYGRLMYEGKLVAAVLDTALRVTLEYEWNDLVGDALGIVVSAVDADGQTVCDSKGRQKTVSGTVGEWKTEGKGTPWTPKQSRKMLAYRGAREWARLYAPAVMLGVYGDDEMTDLIENARAARARPAEKFVGLADPLAAKPAQIEPPAAEPPKDPDADFINNPQPPVAAAETPAPPPNPNPEGTQAPGATIETGSAEGAAETVAPGPSSEIKAEKVAEPKTEAEYVSHVYAYCNAAAVADSLKKLWNSEKKLRAKLNISTETFEELKATVLGRAGILEAPAPT